MDKFFQWCSINVIIFEGTGAVIMSSSIDIKQHVATTTCVVMNIKPDELNIDLTHKIYRNIVSLSPLTSK